LLVSFTFLKIQIYPHSHTLTVQHSTDSLVHYITTTESFSPYFHFQFLVLFKQNQANLQHFRLFHRLNIIHKQVYIF